MTTITSEFDYWLPIARQLIAEHGDVLTPDWYENTLAIWLRDGCRCVYCGFELLQDRRFAYHFYSMDHLLPKKKYPALEHDFTNRVLTCGSCNRVKLQWDPNQAGEIVCDGRRPITDEQRRILVRRVIDYLAEWNAGRDARFDMERALVLGALRGKASGATA